MKIGLALFLIGVCLVVIAWGAVQAARLVKRWWARRQPWQMDEESDGEQVRVIATREGEQELLIGAVPFAARDFDQQLYELRAEGQQKVYALNEETS